jgi:hypothetical protein
VQHLYTMSFDQPLKRKHVMFDAEPTEHAFVAEGHADSTGAADGPPKAKKVRPGCRDARHIEDVDAFPSRLPLIRSRPLLSSGI